MRKAPDGNYYPHRVGMQEYGDPALERVLVGARCFEVKVYRIDPVTWHFKGGPGKINLTTTEPQLLTWEYLARGAG